MSKIKNGMGGSNGGKGRREPTEVLKKESKKPRRKMGLKEIDQMMKDKHE